MKLLPETVQKAERIYKQLERNEHAALYAVFSRHSDPPLLIGYEAFRIKKVPERTVFERLVPAHETYPSDEDFGKTAWSFGLNNLEQARAKYRKPYGKAGLGRNWRASA